MTYDGYDGQEADLEHDRRMDGRDSYFDPNHHATEADLAATMARLQATWDRDPANPKNRKKPTS